MRRFRIQFGRLCVATIGLVIVWGTMTSQWPAPIASAQATAGPAPITVTTLATRRLEQAPPGRRWVLRRGHPINENAHAHAGGFIYAATGATYLVVEDSQGLLMQEGQAAWAPEGIGHPTRPTRRSGLSCSNARLKLASRAPPPSHRR
jgi:hypothetical protein